MPSIKKLVAKHLGKQKTLGVTSATLTLITTGVRTAGSLAGGTNATATDYACKAFVDQERRFMDGTFVAEGRSKLSILGGSIASSKKPVVGATVTRLGVKYKVHRVVTDPVEALFECEVSH